MVDAAPRVLSVPSVRTMNEQAQVTGEDGEVIVVLSPASHRYHVEAYTPDDALLCTGHSRLLSGWLVRDADGADLLTMTGGLFGRYHVRIGERSYLLRGRAYRGDLHVAEGDGRGLPALQSDPAGAPGPRDRTWKIHTDGSLTLAEAVGIVEVHRLEMRRRRKPAPARFALPTPRRLRGL